MVVNGCSRKIAKNSVEVDAYPLRQFIQIWILFGIVKRIKINTVLFLNNTDETETNVTGII